MTDWPTRDGQRQHLSTCNKQSWDHRRPAIGNISTTKLVIATTTQARRHHATVDPVLVHDRRPHRRSKYWGGKFCFLTSTFIMIIVVSEKKNFLKKMLQGLMRCFEAQNPSVHEILYYHKNSTGIWLEVITTHPMPHCDREDAIQHRHLLNCPMSGMSFKILIVIHLIILSGRGDSNQERGRPGCPLPLQLQRHHRLQGDRQLNVFTTWIILIKRNNFIHSTFFRIPFANIQMYVDDFLIPSATFHNIFSSTSALSFACPSSRSCCTGTYLSSNTDAVVGFSFLYWWQTNYLSVETQDPLAEVNMFTGMSKFAKIAWSLTRWSRGLCD